VKKVAIVKNKFPEITSFRDCTEHHILGLQNVMSEAVLNVAFVVKEINQ
jgi:galactokinase